MHKSRGPGSSQSSIVASGEGAHGAFTLKYPHHKSDPTPVQQPDSMIFRGKFRSLMGGAASSKTSPASSEAGTFPTGPSLCSDELSAAGSRYDSPKKGEGSESLFSTREIGTKADINVEKWIGIAGWCRC